ncbi:carboxyphosphonoenolpyruvate mutase [Rhizodiscina lignyota]|uniref:Carboxyphosphonoenolpyruvate mutase n=1 Tax=Rhizodiscina lignyota TaxID=1504668 RepID=A0A9P4IIQ7_9PEZI|nr:carboxyphosphonoenolpyruvate mutase [Rhizodiscina lignyota]
MLQDPEKIVVCPGVLDGFTARIALDVGFDALYMTGAGTAACRLGAPDFGIINMTEMAANASMIANLDDRVPLIADADTGFGSSLSVRRMVRTYIDGNVAAFHIEDQAFMKRCGHLRNKELVSLDQYLTRIRAASMARAESGRDIVIIARTDALQSLGFDEAIRRLKAVYEAGADVAFIDGLLSKEQAKEMVKRLAPMPCLLNIVHGGVTPPMTAQEAKEYGFKIVIWSILSMAEIYNATHRAMTELRDTGFLKQREDGTGGIEDVFRVCGINESAEFDAEAGGESFKGGFF